MSGVFAPLGHEMEGDYVIEKGQMALHASSHRCPLLGRCAGEGRNQNCPANRDRTVDVVCGGLSEGRYEHRSVG
jgi:hypothetical protein